MSRTPEKIERIPVSALGEGMVLDFERNTLLGSDGSYWTEIMFKAHEIDEYKNAENEMGCLPAEPLPIYGVRAIQ